MNLVKPELDCSACSAYHGAYQAASFRVLTANLAFVPHNVVAVVVAVKIR